MGTNREQEQEGHQRNRNYQHPRRSRHPGVIGSPAATGSMPMVMCNLIPWTGRSSNQQPALAGRPTGATRGNTSRAHTRSTFRSVAVPREHGGWGITLEPALPTPIIPSPPARDTAEASSPPATPPIGAFRIGAPSHRERDHGVESSAI